MSKRILAAFMVSLFVLSAALMAVPTTAHTTLGTQTDGSDPNNMYRIHDVDTNFMHVPGPTGYVFPGGGKDWLLSLSPEYPGYQSPWTNYPTNAPNFNWYQVRYNSYTPFGAILTSSDEYDNVGDLIFAVNFTTASVDDALVTARPFYNYDRLTIYIPPEFTSVAQDWNAGQDQNIITTLTTDWGDISVAKADPKDPFGPGWWRITIVDGVSLNFTQAHQYAEWFYVRVNGIAAPKIAGRYMFKMFLNESYPILLTDPNIDGIVDNFMTSTMPVENWPVLLVKGEIDPGIAFGTVRFGGYDINLYGLPIPLAGRVRFVGEATDPYTGELTGRNVEARGYFNGSANGHYEVEGIAPGIYDVYASCAGYPEMLVATEQIILPGKSLHLDIYLQPGAIIDGRIYAKHNWGETYFGETAASWWWDMFGENNAWSTPWSNGVTDSMPLPVSVEIYDSNEWPEPAPGYVWGEVNGDVGDYMTFELGGGEMIWTDTGYQLEDPPHLMSFSPKNLTDSPFTSYDWSKAMGPNPLPVAFPWDDTTFHPLTPSGYGNTVRHNGVGPPQTWWVAPGATMFPFAFGAKNLAGNVVYGAPTTYMGHVPQVFATWVNGLEAGKYWARVWIPGFVQTDAAGNYVDYWFEVASEEWAADIDLWIDVNLNGVVLKEVHFHDLPGTIQTGPIQGPDPYRWLIAEARDAAGNLVAFNFVPVNATFSSIIIPLWGFGWSGFESPANDMWSYFLYKYRHIRDYGMMPGTYTIYVYMRGYVQQEFEMASITLSGDKTMISNHMYRGAGINITVFSMDSQVPPIFRDWRDPGEKVKVSVYRYEDDVEMTDGEIFYWDCDSWETPLQAAGFDTLPNANWPDCASKLKFNGSTWLERKGPDNKKDKTTPEDLDEKWNLPGGFVGGASHYRDGDFNTKVALETGRYYFDVDTKGYVYKWGDKDDKFTVFASKGAQADVALKVIIGAWIEPTIIFKKENIFDHAKWNITMMIRVFDEDGNQVKTKKVDLPYCTTTWTGDFNDLAGLDAYPNYEGSWTIEVETWINYWGTYAMFGPDAWYGWGTYRTGIPDSILTGYGYRVVAGEVRGDFDFNHLGPYSQAVEVTVPNMKLGEEASPVFELDLMGFMEGQLAGYTWSGDLRTMSWANIILSGAAGEFTSYSFDGYYSMFAPPGDDYTLTVEEWPGDVGHKSQTIPVTVPDGGVAVSNFLNMERSSIPIPEFPVALLPTLAALGASLFLTRRRRK